MKKLFYIAAVAALALTSCQQEKDINGGAAAGDNDIAFSLQAVATRSTESVSTVTEGGTISLGKIGNFELFMEETVTDLNYAPETKGTPVYTENVGYLYSGKLGVYTDAAGGIEASYTQLSNAPSADGWYYQHHYTQNIWPDTDPIQFYLRMPTDMTSYGVAAPTSANGVTTVSKYTSPEKAENQQDIIFGGIKMTHEEYKNYMKTKGGAPVTLYHALTGVKFAIANEVSELANIEITKISFIGLKNTGSFTFTIADHSFDWGEGEAAPKADPTSNIIYQDYTVGDLITYDAETDNNNFAESYYKAGNKQNLNDAKATKTFWLIPQDFPSSSTAKLRIDFKQGNGTDYIEIPIKDLKTPNWQAAQLRTYTFKIDEVNLKIRDDVEIKGTASDGYKGSVKSGVTITNTGNTRAFIRAAIVGQWVDANNDAVFGFTDEINQLYIVESWYEDQFVTKTGATAPARKHGKFVDLSGYDKDNGYNNWVLCKDGYYYYTVAIDPEDPEVTGSGVTAPLFTSYMVGEMPKASLGGVVLPGATMHFELEIATQAIKANKLDGTPNSWDEAWKEALGAKPEQK